jgi:hypothetical protein
VWASGDESGAGGAAAAAAQAQQQVARAVSAVMGLSSLRGL